MLGDNIASKGNPIIKFKLFNSTYGSAFVFRKNNININQLIDFLKNKKIIYVTGDKRVDKLIKKFSNIKHLDAPKSDLTLEIIFKLKNKITKNYSKDYVAFILLGIGGKILVYELFKEGY